VWHDRLGNQEHPPLAAGLDRQAESRPARNRRQPRRPRLDPLPDSLVEFGRIGAAYGSPACAPGRRSPRRCEQLIEVAFAHAAAEGKREKMELLYHYLAGDQFRRRIEATVEAFTARQRGLDGECWAMQRIWREREKQIERVLANTGGMYGEVRGRAE
jgi:hypothetical protein